MTERSDEDNGIRRATEPMRLADEITTVTVRKVRTRRPERLQVITPTGGSFILLDPMQMGTIAGQKPETFSVLLAQSLGCKSAD